MQLLRLLQLLLLPAVVDAFGGLNYVSTNTGTSNGAAPLGRHGEDGRPTDGPEGGTSADLRLLQVLPIV